MMNAKKSAMQEALAKRRGNGIDINFILGNGLGGITDVGTVPENEKHSDLAPKGAPMIPAKPSPGMAGYEKGQAMLQAQAESEDGAESQEDAKQEAEDILQGMSENDMEDLKGRKPRSLGDRVKMSAMNKMSK